MPSPLQRAPACSLQCHSSSSVPPNPVSHPEEFVVPWYSHTHTQHSQHTRLIWACEAHQCQVRTTFQCSQTYAWTPACLGRNSGQSGARPAEVLPGTGGAKPCHQLVPASSPQTRNREALVCHWACHTGPAWPGCEVPAEVPPQTVRNVDFISLLNLHPFTHPFTHSSLLASSPAAISVWRLSDEPVRRLTPADSPAPTNRDTAITCGAPPHHDCQGIS